MSQDPDWLKRLNEFERQETLRQIEYKNRHWPGLPDGAWSKNPECRYPHILPEGSLEKVFYPGIGGEVIQYCEENDIAIHSEALNLRSSQVSCFNVMFPLRRNLDLAAVALQPLLPGVVKVNQIEFEYTGDAGATEWLGEPAGGKRGQNRTSIDVAVWWEDGKQKNYLTLVEWKYTEKGFGSCGGYASSGNQDRELCNQLDVMAPDMVMRCYLTQGRNKRRYWERLEEAGICLAALARTKGCPFRGPFYQLMRQYLLAAYLRKVEAVDRVEVAAVAFGGNRSLLDKGKEVGDKGTVIEAWNRGLSGETPKLRHTVVEEIVGKIRSDSSGEARDLAGYLGERYGV
ncbi:MAG TPA: hypothetical protein VHY08_11050 [Bacillota bacterium]|nr:hypothetical protein [Bacillota bacterium]